MSIYVIGESAQAIERDLRCVAHFTSRAEAQSARDGCVPEVRSRMKIFRVLVAEIVVQTAALALPAKWDAFTAVPHPDECAEA